MDKTDCSIPCNLCGSTEVKEVSLFDRDHQYLRTVICCKCGLLWSDPRPNEEEVRNYYSKDYRINYKGTHTPKLKHIYRAGKVARHRYERIKHLVSAGDRILDIGAGAGEYIYLMRKLGYDASGIEPNEGYGQYAKEHLDLPIQIGFAQQIVPSAELYNVVTMHHVLEHLDDPCLVLTKLYDSIADDGFLIIEVPNVEGTCFAPIHRFHNAHLYNFNLRTLEAIGVKAGFSVFGSETLPDGGVIITIFRKTGSEAVAVTEIPSNCERIVGIIRNHTPASHFLTIYPFVRPFDKLRMNLAEKNGIRGCRSGRDVLERLFESEFPVDG